MEAQRSGPPSSQDPLHLSGFYPASGGASLFWQAWLPQGSALKGTVIIVHGIGEHSGRYAQTARRLNAENLSVYAFDAHGHGRSPGRRGNMRRLTDAVGDMDAFVGWVRQRSSGRPVLLAHSLGAFLSTRYAALHGEKLEALILSSPVWGIRLPIPFWERALARATAAFWPSLTLVRPGLGRGTLSHDPDVEERYHNDPLVHFRANVGMYIEVREGVDRLGAILPKLKVPLLVLAGGNDRLADVGRTQELFPLVGSPIKRLIVYEGFFHEVLNEIGKERVLEDMLSWLRASRPGGLC